MNARPRALLIAEAANPEWVSIPLAGWFIADAVRRTTDAHIVTQIRNRDAFLRAGLEEGRDFTAIDNEFIAGPVSKLTQMLRMGQGKGWTIVSAMAGISYPAFERMTWKRFENDLRAGRFDVVHRITPRTPTIGSPMAKWCRGIGVPFILGPLNGGLPWPPGYEAERLRERELLSYLRDAYKLLPGRMTTLENADRILCGSQSTMAEIPVRFSDKTFYTAPNGIDPTRFTRRAPQDGAQRGGPLRACFIGRLVPYKGPDMLIEAAAPMLREGRLEIDFLGGGPMAGDLEALVAREGVGDRVRFHGSVPHKQIQDIVAECEIMAFPSIREFGGAVILEAMALGVVPLVVDYGGPGEFVDETVGFKVPIRPRGELIVSFREALERIYRTRETLPGFAAAALARIDERYTWDRIAQSIVASYEAVLSARAAA